MECQQQYGEEIMIPIFYDVEPSVVRNQTESFGESFKRHEEKENTEKLKRWKKALKDAGEISGYHLQNDFNGFHAACVETVTNDIFTRVNRSIKASSTVLENFVGLETRVDYIGKLLTQEPDDVQFIGIWGMGGIGKTTIAMVVLEKFSSKFDRACCFLKDVKEHKITELQETLLKTILKVEKMEIRDEIDGMGKIEQWLRGKKVLIVLDDVNKPEQLEKLARSPEWFGKGSRVIITTRDVGVLREHGVDKYKYLYEVRALEPQKAIQLFSCYAFQSKIPATGFEQLSRLIVHYCKGLPLALKVLGSSLCGVKAADEWENTFKELKGTPINDIHEILKISFDRLDSKNKEAFLHIACFFRYHKEEHVKDVLKSCNLLPPLGLRLLIEKSLISVLESGRIEMHDLIQEMGWHIARKEVPRSRVWEFKEVDDVLSRKMDPKHIKSIVFPYTCGFRWQNNENIRIAFEGLKILIGKRSYNEEDNNFDLVVKDNYDLPSSLELIHFPDYPFPSLPTSFHPSGMDDNPLELLVISLRRCSLENCSITKELSKLTYLNLSSSYSLLETPNFDMMPHLKKLYLSDCEKLVEIHSSVGRLEKLVLLDLSKCRNLKKLPRFIRVSSLKFLKLEYCSNLENFPEIQANMPLVGDLILKSLGIRELPSSIGRLSGLTVLHLIECNYLVLLCNELCELESLKFLELRDCYQLESLPENIGNLSNLKELFIIDTAIFQLPPSITRLSLLECLCWGGNQEVQEIDEERSLKFVPSVAGLWSLKRLQLSDFNIIDEGLPSDLEYLESLEYLSLRESDFVDLPESFSQLPRLKYLDIKGCRQLKKLPETTREEEEQPDLPKLPESTRELYADSRFASRRNITKLLAECPELHAVAFSEVGNDPFMGLSEYFLARMCIRFPLPRIPRETPFSVSYSVAEESVDESLDAGALRLFQYRCYQSNGISIDLTNDSWYRNRFVGFAVYFISSGFDMWGPHSYEGIHCVEHCTAIAKLSHSNNRNKDRQRECVIVNADDYTCGEIKGHICFAYIPFSSLCPESSTNTKTVTAKDFSRFEVKFKNLEATADWGCSFLYQRRKRLASREDICSCTHTLPSRNYFCQECKLSDLGPLHMLEYMNLRQLNFMTFKGLPEFISQFRRIQYLDISGCARVRELPELPLTLKELYAPYNKSLASENNITELATKYSELSSVSFSFSMHDGDDRAYLKPGELAEKFIPITQPFLNRNTPFAVSYPSDIMWSDDYKIISKCFKYPHNDSNKISISLDPTWYNHSFVGFVVCFQFPIKVRWESHPAILPFRHCELIAKLTHKDNGSEPDPLQTKCVIGRLYDEEFYDHFEDGRLVCFAYIPFSSLWTKSEVITDTTTPNHYSVFEAAFQDLEISKHFNAEDWEISTDWSCGLLYKSLIEELQQKRENGSSESDSEEEEEEEEDNEDEEDDEDDDEDEDDGSQHEDDAMTEDNNLGHSAESPIDISDDGSEPSEHGDSGKEGESIDCDEDVDEFESDGGHSSGAAMAKHRAEMQSNEGRGIRVKRSGVKTCIGSPPTKKRTLYSTYHLMVRRLSPNVPFDGEEDGAGHGAEVAMLEYNDSVNEKGKEREDEQRKKSSSKQNRKIRDQSDELSPTGTQPPIVGDDVLQQMWDNFNCLLASFPLDEEYIKLEIDQTIFHHTDTCSTFMLITDIKDMMKMDFIDASIIKLFILFLNRLCNQFQVTSIGFVCPVEISMNEVKQNVPDITPYLTHVMEQHKNKQFILAPYLQKSHWLLLVICISSKSIYVLDPKPHNRTIEIKNNLNRALHSVSTNERNINWKPCKCPIQPGGVECGYYVMRYMFDIVTKYSSFECLDKAFESNNQYSINEINEIRDLWAKYFLEECIGISVHST